jgi:hypothetical protein
MNGNGVNQEPIETREIKPRDPRDTMATAMHNGQWYTCEEARELKRREIRAFETKDNREKWEKSEAGQLCMAFYQAFQAYRKYMEENPSKIHTPYGSLVNYDEHKLFEAGLKVMEQDRREREETARKNLEKAQRAARCQHVHTNGDQCGAPRVRGKKLCHMHERIEEAKAEALDLGSMEDPDSIQVAIQRLQKAIIDGKLTGKQVGQLAYTIQLAAWNVTRTSMVQE